MKEVDQALKQAIDNLNVDNLEVTKEQIEIIKQELLKEEKEDTVINQLIKISNRGKTNGK